MIGKLGFFMLFLTTIVMLQAFVEETEASNSDLKEACADGGNSDCKEVCQEIKSKKTKKCFCSGTCTGSKCNCKNPTCKCKKEKEDDGSGEKDDGSGDKEDDGPNDD